MIIDCISDLHGKYPKLQGGDLLIVAGDLTARDTQYEYVAFFSWLEKQKYKKIVFIGGNHDNQLTRKTPPYEWQHTIFSISHKNHIEYLCDSSTEFERLKIWGSPWSLWFEGINFHCTAFTGLEEELAKKYALIPDDIDILITHSPPYGIFDKTKEGKHVGSISLRNRVLGHPKLKLHVFGHIHECGGKMIDCVITKLVNASIMNEDYEAVNKPVRIEL